MKILRLRGLVPLMAGAMTFVLLSVPAALRAQEMTDEATSPTQEVVDPPIADADLAAIGEPISEEEQSTALDEEALRRLLAQETDFVYDHEGLRDPMLLPWVYYIARAQAYLNAASAAIAKGRLSEAELALDGVERTASEMAESGYNLPPVYEAVNKAQEQRAQLVNVRATIEDAQLAADMAAGGTKPKLPSWIETNTRGVIFDGNTGTCLVGQYVLRKGDRVPGQAVEVYVDSISEETVVFRVYDEKFPVTVRSLPEGE